MMNDSDELTLRPTEDYSFKGYLVEKMVKEG